jgi:predicted ATPase/class 3 adenylate cyclase
VSAQSGTVTFLFTDIEGSTRLWQADEAAMHAAMSRHDELLRETVADHDGVVFSTMGDGIAAAFPSPAGAVAAALTSQRLLKGESWPTVSPVSVRMGIHTGEALVRDGNFFGTAVNRAARLMAIGYGGQVLISSQTAGLVDGVEVADLGWHRLRDLSEPMQVFQVGEGRFPPLRSLDLFLGNLPLQVSSFIGREREIERGVEALGSSRIVTLTGVGGVGKTRLGLELAEKVLPRFRDGAWLVELAPVRDPGSVADAVASVFGVSARSEQSVEDGLIEFFRTKQMLVVLDNCEHLLDAAANLVEKIGHSCAGLVVLATSREGLAIDGECIFGVPSLATPSVDADFNRIARAESVTLFVQRAQMVGVDFELTAENAASVARVCRRLDGVPLAIELAAARVKAMNPTELADGLERRFETLSSGRRGAPERHQTLRSAIDWSYDLLSGSERRLLARMSVFAGGCTRDSATAVCAGDPIDRSAVFQNLTRLVDRSLVVAERDGSATRYRLLETIREYGEERLAEHCETEVLRRRHGQHYLELAHRLIGEAAGPGEADAAHRSRAEEDNLLAAMANATDTGNLDVALGLMVSHTLIAALNIALLPPFGLDVFELEGATVHPLYPAGLATAAALAGLRGEVQAAEQFCAAALDAAERLDAHTPSLDYSVSVTRAAAATHVGAFTAAAARYEHCVEIARATGLPNALAHSLGQVATSYVYAGDLDRALPYAAEALSVARRSAPPTTLMINLAALAAALSARDPEQGRSLLGEAIGLADTFADARSGPMINMVVLAAARLEEWDQALRLALTPIRDYHWQHQDSLLGGILTVVARAVAASEAQGAARLQGAARRLMTPPPRQDSASSIPDQSTPRGGHPPRSDTSHRVGITTYLYRQTTAILLEALSEARLRELRSEGAALDNDQAVALALDVTTRARALSRP